MSMIEERAGRQWAAETCEIASRDLFKLSDGITRLLAKLEAGKQGKPAAFVRGIQKVIDSVKCAEKQLSRHQKKIVQPQGMQVDQAFVDEHRET